VANTGQPAGQVRVSVQTILSDHWKRYGRNLFTRYDYEELETSCANAVIQRLKDQISLHQRQPGTLEFGGFLLKECDNFQYQDPVDQSLSKDQGLRFVFADGSRAVFRLSGTGSSGATLRMYLDRYLSADRLEQITAQAQESLTARDLHSPTALTQALLHDLVVAALALSDLPTLTGRLAPTVIT
jgi:phosphoglucomutase